MLLAAVSTGRRRLALHPTAVILIGMHIRRRILSVLLSAGLVLAFGLPAQASWIGAMDGAMAADSMMPSGDCRHCDMQNSVDMAACHAVCLAMPALLPGGAPVPTSVSGAPRLWGPCDAARGQSLEPDSGPPKFTCII